MNDLSGTRAPSPSSSRNLWRIGSRFIAILWLAVTLIDPPASFGRLNQGETINLNAGNNTLHPCPCVTSCHPMTPSCRNLKNRSLRLLFRLVHILYSQNSVIEVLKILW